MESFKKHRDHHKRHGHRHQKKQFGDYQTILDPVQGQNNMYLDEKPIIIEEQKSFTNNYRHGHYKGEFKEKFDKEKHRD